MSHEEDDIDSDGLPLIRIVPNEELNFLRPKNQNISNFRFELTKSLENSIRYFIMATAARHFRESQGFGRMDFSTMMIHTSQRVAVHGQTKAVIQRELSKFKLELANKSYEKWESLWNEEMEVVDLGKVCIQSGLVKFQELIPCLEPVSNRCKIIVSNSNPNEETNVNFDVPNQVAIVIGGNTLSRGLTLEGLVVSFFVRSANAYDTILQMGRWFGYRPFYEDLPRIWMTLEMAQHFHSLAAIENEFRDQVDDYRAKGLKPLDAAIRIRRLPSLQITAANKMRFAVTAEVDYGGARPQTIYFYRKDQNWLLKNAQAARDIVAKLGKPVYKKGGHIVWHGCSSREILNFLNDYSFHDRSRELNQELIEKSWLLGQTSERLVFNTGCELIWKASIQTMDEWYHEIIHYPIDPLLN